MENSETINEEQLTPEQENKLEFMREKLIIGMGLSVAQVERMNYNMASIQYSYLEKRLKVSLV